MAQHEAPFIGRKNELASLSKFLKKKTASLIVVTGRRRIGKSRLITEFSKKHKSYIFSGIPPLDKITDQMQKDEFAIQLSSQMDLPRFNCNDWTELFNILAKKTKNGRVIILFDEITWMGSKDPAFLGKLKNAWDLHFKKNPKLILFLCGSISSWIEKNIISSTGYMGRISYTLNLNELPLDECNNFWPKNISSYEKFKILAVTGGIPRYLEEILPSATAEENIKNLCFSKGGVLVYEFDKIFSDLFKTRSSFYKQIINLLANGALEYNKICDNLNYAKSGQMSEYLNELILSGFISQDYAWNFKTGLDSRHKKYRLKDNYLRFYLKYILKNISRIERSAWGGKTSSSLPAWETVMGLQFENLVLNNRFFILNNLHLTQDQIIADNPYIQHQTNRKQECQIDLLIQSKHQCLYVCEIKFSKNPINKKVINEVQQKINALAKPRGFSYRPVLIHINGVTDDLIDADYFSDIINFSDIFE